MGMTAYDVALVLSIIANQDEKEEASVSTFQNPFVIRLLIISHASCQLQHPLHSIHHTSTCGLLELPPRYTIRAFLRSDTLIP